MAWGRDCGFWGALLGMGMSVLRFSLCLAAPWFWRWGFWFGLVGFLVGFLVGVRKGRGGEGRTEREEGR